MAQDQKPSVGPEKGRTETDKTKGIYAAMTEDTCRCKEVAKKTLPEMLKLMLNDLAFWRRSGRHK